MKGTLFEVARYIINGLFATAVHFGVLFINIEHLGFSSAGLANFVAAIFGISASFLGNRFFVFSNTQEAIASQAMRFFILYGMIAVLHGGIMFIWVDQLLFSYKTGFLVATMFQLIFSYFGNKFLVFTT